MNDLGEKIYKLREEKRLSQDDLAEMLDVSRQTISNWETGRVRTDVGKLVLLCEKLELSLDSFLLDREAKKAERKTVSPPASESRITKKMLIRTAILSAVAAVILVALAFVILLLDYDTATENLMTIEVSLFVGMMIGAGLFFVLLVVILILVLGKGGQDK